jgi:two-component sensor histidine kinase
MKAESVDIFESDRSPVSNEHLLVRELTHRISNELSSLIGHVSLAASRSPSEETKAVLSDVMSLLHRYADVHRALQMPTFSTVIDASGYIRALCQSITRARLDHRNIEVVFVDCPLQMHSARCWKLGMIVSELITNSARHAFGDRGGIIQVELSRFGAIVQCCIRDNGSSRSLHKPGEGLKIVDALAKELNGEIIHRFGLEGATSILTFPIDGGARRMRMPKRARTRDRDPNLGKARNDLRGAHDFW